MIGTRGDDVHDPGAAVIVDPGGNDQYLRTPATGGSISVIVDLGGDAGPEIEVAAAGEHAGMGAYAYLHDLGAAGPPETLVPPPSDLWPMACYGTMTP